MDICYSNNGEDWKDFECAIEAACQDLKDGDVFELAEGVPVRADITKFFDAYTLLEEISDNAASNYGEFAEGFASDIAGDKEAVAELQSALDFIIYGWAKKHHKLPDFFDIEQVRWNKWKVLNVEEYEIEAVHD